MTGLCFWQSQKFQNRLNEIFDLITTEPKLRNTVPEGDQASQGGSSSPSGNSKLHRQISVSDVEDDEDEGLSLSTRRGATTPPSPSGQGGRKDSSPAVYDMKFPQLFVHWILRVSVGDVIPLQIWQENIFVESVKPLLGSDNSSKQWVLWPPINRILCRVAHVCAIISNCIISDFYIFKMIYNYEIFLCFNQVQNYEIFYCFSCVFWA